MMKKYKLIHEIETARFYKLSKLSTYTVRNKEIKPYRYVVISDAITHVERLAFSFEFMEGSGESDLVSNKKDILKVELMYVCGYITFMGDGGDIDSVYPDEWYLDKITGR